MTCLFLFYALLAGNLPMEAVRSFAEVPPESDVFLQNPVAAVFDQAGHLYVLDVEATRVFVWNLDGSFKQTIGAEGQGPGEFSFRARWGPSRGYMGIVDDQLKVYARGQSRISSFALSDYSYQNSVRLENLRGLELGFEILTNGNYLLLSRTRGETAFSVALAFYNEEGKRGLVLAENEDETIDLSGDRGNRKITIKAYEPSYVIAYNDQKGEIIVGHSEKPKLTHYDLKGQKTGEVAFDIPRREVTAKDKAEYEQVLARRGSGRVTFDATFPDMHPFFEKVLPLQDRGFLVYSLSPEAGRLVGYVIDRSGKTLGRVQRTMGENSSLHTSRGKIIAIQSTEEGDFVIEEMAQSFSGS